jgi:hypothetical protein
MSSSTVVKANLPIVVEKEILMIRHGRSLGNDLMSKPGNEWGAPTFRDDPSLIDA